MRTRLSPQIAVVLPKHCAQLPDMAFGSQVKRPIADTRKLPGVVSNAGGCGRAKRHKSQILRHNLRMHPCAKLTNPNAIDRAAFGKAVQSNKVYPPRLSSCAFAGIARRRINAIR